MLNWLVEKKEIELVNNGNEQWLRRLRAGRERRTEEDAKKDGVEKLFAEPELYSGEDTFENDGDGPKSDKPVGEEDASEVDGWQMAGQP